MKLSAFSSLSVLSLMIGTLTLVGCGGAFSMPDSVVASPGVAPPIQGSVFGGHAPIVGSHVYLLQPSTSGYGYQATSLLGNNGATSANGYALSTNPATGGDPYIPSGWQYVTTDSLGGFSLTGAYSCTANQPVYIYSYGGNATNLTGTPTNTAIVELAMLGTCPNNGSLATDNFFSGGTAISYVYVNEVSTVAAAYVLQPFTVAGTTNVATGTCKSATNPTAPIASAICVGSSGTTEGLLGLANAAATAAQLYSIQGNADLSSANDGEGHVANYQTVVSSTIAGVTTTYPNVGNGVVPEATIDTLANILAACVDNTGSTSTPCTTLFTNATETGDSSGTKPTDIARAAMDIARYPAGNYSNGLSPTSFVTNLFNIPSATVPYVPNLKNSPPDFTIAINYPYTAVGVYSTTNNDVEKAESIAVDNEGQIWITAQGGGDGSTNQKPTADRWSPLGVANAQNTNANNYLYGYVSIDGKNNAWAGFAIETDGIFYAGSNGVFHATYGSGYADSYVNIADNAGDDYFFAKSAATGTNYEMFEFPYGSTASTVPTEYSISPTPIAAGNNVAHGAIDASGDFWLTEETGLYQIAKVSATGTQLWNINTGVKQPEFVAIDALGNGWIPSQTAAGPVYKISTLGVSTSLLSGTGTGDSGATFYYPFGSAVDGNGNVWITNRCGAYNVCSSPAATNSSTLIEINGTTNLAISPPSNFKPETQYPATAMTLSRILLDPLNIAIDPSGNLWITNYTGGENNGSVVEIIGTAAPIVTPLAYAAGKSELGTKP